MRILVVEADDRVARSLESARPQHDHEVVRARAGEEALRECRRDPPPDLVIVDLGLPGVDAARLAIAVRRDHAVPVIAVTASGVLASREDALRSEVDDYVVGPFASAELLARIEVALARAHGGDRAPAAVEIGELRIDLAARTVAVGGTPVVLTREELDVLVALARAEGATVGRGRLLDEVCGTGRPRSGRALEADVATLRAKLGPATIETVRGVGYRLAAPRPARGAIRP